MSETCNHDCGSCGQACEEKDLHARLNDYSQIKRVVAVSSGKGGVGKSSVTAMLAVLMARRGYKVGILDADITGPSIPKAFGITLPIWSKTEGWVIAVLSVITSWKVFGYNFIVILAGVSGVSTEVIEAARLDDVPNWKIFRDIVVPMSSATGIYVFIITIVQGLQYVFTPIKVVTQGGPNYASSNMIYQSYHEAFTLYRTGVSSAVSVLTMALFIVLLLLEFRFVEKGVYYEN